LAEIVKMKKLIGEISSLEIINWREPKTYFFSEKEIEEYVRLFPQGTKIIMEQHVLDCCDQGHTWREIMGYDKWNH